MSDEKPKKPKKEKKFSLLRPAGTKLPDVPPDYIVRETFPTPARMIVDGDNHYPMQDPVVQAAKFMFAEDFKPSCWVNLGDQYDFWSISRHDHEADKWFTPGSRLQEEFDSAQSYWKDVCRIAEHVHFIRGNHENRLERLINANLGLFGLRAFDLKTLAAIPEKVRVHEYGALLEIGGITIEHGDRLGGKLGVLHAAEWVLRNRGSHTIFGHLHRQEIKYRTLREGTRARQYVAVGQGHGADAKKLRYAGPVPNWQEGFTAVEFYTVGGKPRFTIHQIAVVEGRFIFGGIMYDGRKA